MFRRLPDHRRHTLDSDEPEIFGFHTGSSNVLFGDGSVRFVKNGLTMNQMQALLSRRGGEVIGFDY